jgi:hypothetical protein
LGNNNAICSRISEGTKIKLTSGDTGPVLDTSDIRAGGRGERLQHHRKSHFDMDVVLRLMFWLILPLFPLSFTVVSFMGGQRNSKSSSLAWHALYFDVSVMLLYDSE